MKEIKDFNWNKPTNSLLGELFPADKLDRARYATFLSRLLAQEGFDESWPDEEQKKNYVLNLNAEWGAGKTYFLKRWSQELIVNYPVVYIDAWQQDYSDDPFLTVIAGIIKQLQLQAKFNIKIPKSAVSMFKAVAPAIAQGLTKKISGIDLDELHTLLFSDDEIDTEQKQSSNKPSGSDFSPAVKALAQNLIKDHEAKNKSIEVIKSKLADWVSKFEKQEGKSLPIFIFIDELDRCRPSYAVEMLETIKHIFDVKGIVFVVATDTEQLQHTIKSIYGEGFDAKIYLGRFFNSRYSLKRPVLKDFLSVHSDRTKFESAYLESKNIEILPRTEAPEIALTNIAVVLDAFKVSPRTAIQITERITAIIISLPSGKKVDVLVLAVLFCIHEKDHSLYEEIISGRFQRKETNYTGKIQDISLSTFLQSIILREHLSAELTYFFEPQSYTSNLYCENVGRRKNNYSDGSYPMTFSKFIADVFCNIFSGKADVSFMLSEYISGNGVTDQQKAENELAESNVIISEEVTILWLNYIYIKDGYNKITNDQYRDFIELSSPLDYMGDS
ncbi:KAP family NTPase [Pseudoalteromonas sp. CR1]|uniref:KAP family P-loop NTPase fold protein n=1 Tax=Pseudoalteromonas sp. CR1 TaxID=2861964 RepID=UPI001C5DDD98|nr:P-loop NTPase fold protein [Pseudoalteromonas sp. CR1]MBW4966160.1 KAP family NTPase [Pseudoalteromonas sp. CR1]|tara:strand:+ start:790 stop:2463 length:1674 start_codon:yes stop_codon:yes gene_type:complete